MSRDRFGRPSLNDLPSELPRFRWPRVVGKLNPQMTARSIPISGKGWIQFAGVHSGWFVSEAPDAPPMEIFPFDMLPGVPTQRIFVQTVGTGEILVREFDEEIGGILASAGLGRLTQGNPSPSSATSVVATTQLIKSNTPVAQHLAPAGSKGITVVNRSYLSDGVTPNTHNLTVGPTNTVTAAGANGSLLVPGQSYSFPAGQSFFYIPDGAGAVDMVVEYDTSY